MKQTVSAVFESMVGADQAVQDLVAANIPTHCISIVMSRETRERFYPEGNSGTGSIWSIGIADLARHMVAVSSPAVPRGLFVVGPLAALAGGPAVDALGGGVLGALIAVGIPEISANDYETRLRRGGIVVAAEVISAAEVKIAQRSLFRAGGPVCRETLEVSEHRL